MEALQTLSQNNRCQDPILKILQPPKTDATDRPGWIPPDIIKDWDTDPYAYQTEEELMPAGWLHGELLTYVGEMLRDFLKTHGLRYLADTFMLYRDRKGIKRRISPDFIITPLRSLPSQAYNLDIEPVPIAVAEITSPKSHVRDMETKVAFYTGMGISAYLVIDSVTSRGEPHEQINLHLWRIIKGRVRKTEPDAEGYLQIPEIKLKVKAQARNLIFAEIKTGMILCDLGQQRQLTEREARLREQETILRKHETERADRERRRADQLAAKLRELGIATDS